MSLKAKIEAILFLTDRPIKAQAIARIANVDVQLVRQGLLELIHDYEERDGGLEVLNEDGYYFQVKEHYASLMDEFLPVEMSAALIRTLSAIAIKQPIAQSEIIRIRGAGAYEHIRELVTKELVAKKDDGRSPMLSTTKKFQEYFRLTKDGKDLRDYLNQRAKALETGEPVPGSEQQLSIPTVVDKKTDEFLNQGIYLETASEEEFVPGDAIGDENPAAFAAAEERAAAMGDGPADEERQDFSPADPSEQATPVQTFPAYAQQTDVEQSEESEQIELDLTPPAEESPTVASDAEETAEKVLKALKGAVAGEKKRGKKTAPKAPVEATEDSDEQADADTGIAASAKMEAGDEQLAEAADSDADADLSVQDPIGRSSISAHSAKRKKDTAAVPGRSASKPAPIPGSGGGGSLDDLLKKQKVLERQLRRGQFADSVDDLEGVPPRGSKEVPKNVYLSHKMLKANDPARGTSTNPD